MKKQLLRKKRIKRICILRFKKKTQFFVLCVFLRFQNKTQLKNIFGSKLNKIKVYLL